MTKHVVDASLAVKWLVPETNSLAAFELLSQADLHLCAPDFMFAEVGNALYKRMKSGCFLPPKRQACLSGLAD